jgi:hypothetical protein
MAGQAVLLIRSGENLWQAANQQPLPFGAAVIPIPDGQTALDAVAAYVAQFDYPVGTEATFADLGTPSTFDMTASWVQKS